MANFMVPAKIVHGEGSIRQLSRLKGKKAVLVTGGSSMERQGFLQEADQLLREAGFETAIIRGVEADPSLATCLRGAKEMEAFGPDWIVAVGGGSVMDAAKAMWVFYEHPETAATPLKRFRVPPLRKKARLACLPSTAGTASEITAFAIVRDTQSKNKYPLASGQLVPDLAILDPRLTAGMPPHVTAHTGADALVHAIEAYVSTSADDFSDGLARQAIRLIFDWLEQAVKHGEDLISRARMQNAAALAGMAFGQVSLGITHSLAHQVGAKFGMAHGEANGIFLPYVIDFNKKKTTRYRDLEDLLEVGDLAEAVRDLLARVGFASKLGESRHTPLEPTLYRNALPEMVAGALEDSCTLTNPRKPTEEDLAMLLWQAF